MSLSLKTLPRLLLVDGYGFIFRSFYGLPPLTTPNGLPIGAIQGFTHMILQLLYKQKYDVIIVALDKGSSKNTIRHHIHSEYKGNRNSTPSDLITQFPIMREMLSAFGIPYIEQEGVEADDIIAAYTAYGINCGYNVTIASADKDLLQLVQDELVQVYDPIKKKFLNTLDVIDKIGVKPLQVTDYLALIGDVSDNIPGVPGIGPKTAVNLLNKYENLIQIYNNITYIQPLRVRNLLEKSYDVAMMSYQLVSLHIDQITITKKLSDFAWSGIEDNAKNILTFTRQYGLTAIQQKYIKNAEISHKSNKFIHDYSTFNLLNTDANENDLSFTDELLKDIKISGKIALYHQYDMLSQIPHITLSNGKISIDLHVQQIPDIIYDEILNNPNVIKVCHDINEIFKSLIKYKKLTITSNILSKEENLNNRNILSYHDISYMEYALVSGTRNDLHYLSHKYLNNENNNQLEESESSLNTGETLLRLYSILYEKLRKENLMNLYEIDHKLMFILMRMQNNGILINKLYLEQLNKEFTIKLSDITQQIYKQAGDHFNIASPKQVSDVLFNKLNIPSKNKSTSADILEELAMQGFTIAEMIQEWRHIAKLQGTYVVGLLNAISKNSMRIHSTFNATSILTGRISSSNPNLQSIPIKSAEGVKIRHSFIAKEGYQLICADYSQVEIRVLAHMANVPTIQQALKDGVDIHSLTASQVFGIPIDNVSDSWRRRAKMINFGIIYGMSPFGLAKNLGISNFEANQYIKSYFNIYPGIESYMQKTIDSAHKNRYVSTIMGRRCYIANIESKNQVLRKIAERSAINAPIQGSAADIIRKAMTMLPIKLQNYLVLQVHDELIFEVPENEVDDVSAVISETMQNSTIINVPLVVNIKTGKCW